MVEKNKKWEVIQETEDKQLENWGRHLKIIISIVIVSQNPVKCHSGQNLNKVGKAETTSTKITIYLKWVVILNS